MSQDPTTLAYAVGIIAFVIALINTQKHGDALGLVKRIVTAGVIGAIVGGIVYAALGGLSPEKINVGPRTDTRRSRPASD